MKRFGLAGSVACVLLACSASTLADTQHAGPTATGLGDCSDWNNLCTLADAITNHAVSGHEVWAKAGTHGPITLKSGVKVYGGFAGGETAASQSDPKTNVTVIDAAGAAHAVTSMGNDAATVLRGFRITGGYDTSAYRDVMGGGGALLQGSSAMFVECVFDGNWALAFGGAVSIRGNGSPQFINCIFNDNGLDDSPAQEENWRYVTAGGAVYTEDASPTFTNCLFYDNHAMEAAAVAVSSGAPTFINCTIADNEATIGYGGGLYDPAGVATVKNSILWGNTAVRGSHQLGAHPGKSVTVANSNIQGGYAGTNNIASDPLFAAGATDYAILAASPCKDAGDANALPADVGDLDWDDDTSQDIQLDLAMLSRVVSTGVDMGAYEYRDCETDADCSGGMVCCDGLCKDCCDDADCADALFCNGVETCSGSTCVAGSYPCATGQTCNETLDICGCTIDGECSDGVFCNGAEVCVNNSCEAGPERCPGQFCDEVAVMCVWCNLDSDCQTGEKCCSGNCQECCTNMDCPGFGNFCCPSQGFVCSMSCPE